MTSSPGLVSVVIPAFQADAHLNETLRSLSLQTYDSWELIVVEDGSVGRTEEMVDTFGREHPKHRVVYQRNPVNVGPSQTRNNALNLCCGEYVAFLDADDLWVPDHLNLCVERLAVGDCDLAFSCAVTFDSTSGFPNGAWGPTQQEVATLLESLLGRNFVTPSTVVMRRISVEQTGRFDPTLRTCEDLDFWLRAALGGVRFSCLPGCHCFYRKGHEGAATSNRHRVSTDLTRVVERYRLEPAFQGKVDGILRRHYLRAAYFNSGERTWHAWGLLYRGMRLNPLHIDWRCLAAFLACGIGVFRSGIKTFRKLLDRKVQSP